MQHVDDGQPLVRENGRRIGVQARPVRAAMSLQPGELKGAFTQRLVCRAVETKDPENRTHDVWG